MNSRTVFHCELTEGHWVQVNIRGEFDSDVWHALDGFMKRMAVRPAPKVGCDCVPPSQCSQCPPEGKTVSESEQ